MHVVVRLVEIALQVIASVYANLCKVYQFGNQLLNRLQLRKKNALAELFISAEDPETLIDPQLMCVTLLQRVCRCRRQYLRWVVACCAASDIILLHSNDDSILYQFLSQFNVDGIAFGILLFLPAGGGRRPARHELVLVGVLLDEYVDEVDLFVLGRRRQSDEVSINLSPIFTFE